MKLSRPRRIGILIGVVFLLFFGVFFAALIAVERTIEERLSQRFRSIESLEYKRLGVSLILRQMSFHDMKIKTSRLEAESSLVKISLGLSLSEILSLALKRELSSLDLRLRLPDIHVSKVQVNRHRSLQDLRGEIDAELRWRGTFFEIHLKKLNFQNLTKLNFRAQVKTTPLKIPLAQPQRALQQLRSQVLTNWPNYEFVSAEGSIQNLGLSQIVLDFFELPEGQLSLILDAALSLFPAEMSRLSSGEVLTHEALKAANTFFRTQNKLSLAIRPPTPVSFATLRSLAETEMDLGLSRLGVQWSY